MQVEGYLAAEKQEGSESTNCHSVSDKDYHAWLVDDPAKGKPQSVVTEVTPACAPSTLAGQ